MNVDHIEQIKKLAIVAMFSNDEFVETLVLKGGNALDIVYNVAPRASLDLDFSIPTEFDPNKIGEIESKMKKSLTKIFNENGYSVFDIKLSEQFEDINFKAPSFWGGYRLEFKVIETIKFEELSNDPRALRINAIDVGPGSQKTYRVDISKWEYCKPKSRTEIENYTIYVYTPEMIVVEKLRAICQQMPEYTNLIGKSHREARARDFFDIYVVVECFAIDLTTPQNLQLLRDVFSIKQVPIDFVTKIKNYKEYHRPDFAVVESTVKKNIKLKTFDFYFDYVVNKCSVLSKALGII